MRARTGHLLVLLALLAAGCAAPVAPAPEGAPPLASPHGGEAPAAALVEPPNAAFTTHVTAAPGGAEPVILADSGGRYLWIADISGLWRSDDGGLTWLALPTPFPRICDGLGIAQDPADGALHVVNTACSTLQYARSHDGGTTWHFTNLLVDVAPIADRPWISAATATDLAIIFYDFGRGLQETCLASNDGGQTWIERSLPLQSAVKAGNLVRTADGALHYANREGLHRFAHACAPTATSRALPASGEQVLTQLAMDASGRLAVAQPSVGNGQMLLRGVPTFASSALREVVVSPPLVQSNTFGAISATPNGSEIAVAWYGSASPGNPADPNYRGTWHVYVARVHGFWGGAPTVSVTQVSVAPNHVGGMCMAGSACMTEDRDLLDYFGVTHDAHGNVHVAYGHDGAGSAREVRYAFLPRAS